eukprot:1150913-Pelagomonas_calceolata.AAC.5
MRSIGGLAGSVWATPSWGVGGPLSPQLCFHSGSLDRHRQLVPRQELVLTKVQCTIIHLGTSWRHKVIAVQSCTHELGPCVRLPQLLLWTLQLPAAHPDIVQRLLKLAGHVRAQRATHKLFKAHSAAK